jgi:hypothetical protein
MDDLPEDLINYLLSYLNIYDQSKLSLTSKYQNIVISKKILKTKEKVYKIIRLFEKRKNSFYDLRNLNRPGYLLNPKRLYKYPTKYEKKKIQFISKFQYHPYTVPFGKVSEGYLYRNPDDTWNIEIKDNFLNEEGIYFQYLFKPFIFNKSLRIIKNKKS